MMNNKIKKGFTLIEMLVAIGIVSLISFVTVNSFSSFNKNQILNQTRDHIISILEEARSSSVFYKESLQYGVHFEERNTSLFKGQTYSSSDPENEYFNLDPRVRISGINLAGGVPDVVFAKLTGKTDQTGNITISLVSDSAISKTITIGGTGIFND